MDNARVTALKQAKASLKSYRKSGYYTTKANLDAHVNVKVATNERNTNMSNQNLITKQMVRDHLYFSGPISVSSLVHKMLPQESISMSDFNVVMAYILELEQESKVRYNLDTGCYEALYIVK